MKKQEDREEVLSRVVYLMGDIDNKSGQEVINKIIELNEEDDKERRTLIDYEEKPIYLYISSCGGDCYVGMGIMEIVKQSITPVYTVCTGFAFSMGFMVFLSGERRYVSPLSTLCYHEASMWDDGKLTAVKRSIEEVERIEKLLDEYFVDNTKVTRKRLSKYKDECREWYIDCDEALKLGIATDLMNELLF